MSIQPVTLDKHEAQVVLELIQQELTQVGDLTATEAHLKYRIEQYLKCPSEFKIHEEA